MKSIPFVVALGSLCLNSADAQFAPIILNPGSFNQDMIVERPRPATTASLDNGPANTGASFYEQGYYMANAGTGLPPAGSTITASSAGDHSYTFAADYTTNNAVLIDPTVTNATVTFVAPQSYIALSFLVAAGNGAETIAYTVHHADNFTDTGTFVTPDWFNVGANIAYTANGRCDVQNLTFDAISSGNPRLYFADIFLADTVSPVTGIDFKRTGSGGHGAIFAISGSIGFGYNPIGFLGYNKDMIVESASQHLPPNGLYTTASMDGGLANNANGWYVKGFNLAAPTTGLPTPGSTIASAAALDHQYTFATNYSANNVVFVDAGTSGTMTWATPSKHSALSFLASAGHGSILVDYTVNFADASTESGSFYVKDWFNNTPVAYTANGRLDVVTGVYNSVNAGNPRLYTLDINLAHTTTAVTSVNLSFDPANTNSGVVAFFAVSGTGGSIAPVVVSQPAPSNALAASSVQFSAAVSGSTPLALRWQRGDGTVFTNLTDGGRISGSTATNLTVSSTIFSDAAYYRIVATNVAGAATSSPAYLNIISSTPVITAPGNAIVIYNGSSPAAEGVEHAIDGLTSKYLNFGANGGFPPFVGPVGLVVTPAMGSTVVTGIRLFTANDSPERDPAEYVLEGSNDGGNTFAPVTNGTVAMPDDRNNAGLSLDPINEFNREIHFANSAAYTTYRFTINNVKNNITANSMQVGEVQLLGTAPVASVILSFQRLPGGQLQLQWPQGILQGAGSVLGTFTNITGANSPYVLSTANGMGCFRVLVQ